MSRNAVLRCALCALIFVAVPVAARVTDINIAAVEAFADGAGFGNTGAYERVRGAFKCELDPADFRNRVIVNLDKAPRNARGLVEYEADFFMLRPAEAALPGFESVAIYALLAPVGTAKDIVAYLNRETNAVLQLPEVREKLSGQGIEPLGSTPEAVETITRNEVAKWARVIKAAGITPE